MANQILGLPTPEDYSDGFGNTWEDARATSSIWLEDHEGILRECPAGELPFEKARVVQNHVPSSELFDNIYGWSGIESNYNITYGESDPFGGNDAALFDILNITHFKSYDKTDVIEGEVYVFSFYAKLGTSTALKLRLRDVTNGVNLTDLQYASLLNTFTFTRVSAVATVPSGCTTLRFSIIHDSGTGSLGTAYFYGAQVENVTGQANQNPSEYVSAGVSGSTGFAQFSTANGNTVTSNVVTEATGSALSPVPYLVHVPASTNKFPSSNLDTAYWVETNTSITHNQILAPDGTYTGAELIPVGTGYNQFREQGVSVASGLDFTVQVIAKHRDTGYYLEYLTNVVTGNAGAVVDLSDGSVQDSKDCSVTIKELVDGWKQVNFHLTSTNSGNIHDIRVNTNGTFNSSQSSIDGTSGVYVWGAQLEEYSFSTPIIPTTGSSASRNATVLKTPLSAGTNLNDTEGALELKVQPYFARGELSTQFAWLTSRFNASDFLYGNNNIILSDASAYSQRNIGYVSGDILVLGGRWTSNTSELNVGVKRNELAWSWDTNDIYDGAFNKDTSFVLGYNCTGILKFHSLVLQNTVASTAEIEAGLPVVGGGDNLLANDVTSLSSVTSSSLGQIHNLYSVGVTSLSQINSPTVSQIHDLIAQSVASLTALSSPALTASSLSDSLLADDVSSLTSVSNAVIAQVHNLQSGGASSSSDTGLANLQQTHVLTADDIIALTGVSTPVAYVANLTLTDDDINAIASRVLEYMQASNSMLNELHKIHGLDSVNPVTVTPTSRVAGDVTQAISGDGESVSTITRL